MKRTVAIGFIGATLDRLGRARRAAEHGGRASSRTC